MDLRETIRRAVALARPTGVITFDQLNALLPSATTEPEDIEAVMEALSEASIQLTDDDQAQPE